jgi:flagellar basal-body rod modification protein FlgD
MQTTPLTSGAQTTTPSAAAPKKSMINSDFNTFLRMLTTQIKNQDPTNPMESADFAVQLATFSGVEQQVKTNDMLSQLSSQFGVMGMSQLAAWVGQEARAPSPVYLGNSDVTLTYASATGADRAVLSVRDANGNVVGREDVPLGNGPHQWTGFDLKGAPLPNGKYTLTLESYQGERKLGEATPVEAYSRIQEARSGPTGTVLVLEGGIEVPATSVTALRVAGSAGTETGNGASNGSSTAPNSGTTTPPQTQSGYPQQSDGAADLGGAETGGGYDVPSENPPNTLDEYGQPIPETYTPN